MTIGPPTQEFVSVKARDAQYRWYIREEEDGSQRFVTVSMHHFPGRFTASVNVETHTIEPTYASIGSWPLNMVRIARQQVDRYSAKKFEQFVAETIAAFPQMAATNPKIQEMFA